MENAEPPKSRLMEAKQRRQEAATNATLLRNRIALLKAEEDKAWKKIEQTRKRAAELLALREAHEQSSHELREAANQHLKDLQESIHQKRELVLQYDDLEKKREIGMQLTNSKRKEALLLKEAKQKWRQETQVSRIQTLQHAQERKHQIESEKQRFKDKQKQMQHERDQLQKQREQARLAQEETLFHQKEQEVEQMEQLELQLIQRLRNTQRLQKKAFEELEQALTCGSVRKGEMTSNSPTSPAKPAAFTTVPAGKC